MSAVGFTEVSLQTALSENVQIRLFIHSFRSLSYDRSIDSSLFTECETVLPLANFQYPLLSLWSSSSCSRLLPFLPVTFIPPYAIKIIIK